MIANRHLLFIIILVSVFAIVFSQLILACPICFVALCLFLTVAASALRHILPSFKFRVTSCILKINKYTDERNGNVIVYYQLDIRGTGLTSPLKEKPVFFKIEYLESEIFKKFSTVDFVLEGFSVENAVSCKTELACLYIPVFNTYEQEWLLPSRDGVLKKMVEMVQEKDNETKKETEKEKGTDQ